MCKSDVTVACVVGEMHEGGIVGTSGTCAVGVCTWCGGGAVVACGVGEMHEGDVVGAVGVCVGVVMCVGVMCVGMVQVKELHMHAWVCV